MENFLSLVLLQKRIYQTKDQGIRYFPEFQLNEQLLETFLLYNNQLQDYLFKNTQDDDANTEDNVKNQINKLSEKLKEIKQWYQESQSKNSLLPNDQTCYLQEKFQQVMEKNDDDENNAVEDDMQITKKKIAQLRTKTITKCIHKNEKHYAKGYCKPCYMKYGRNKVPTKCCHKHAVLYAKGMCHNCYMNIYLQEKNKQSSTSCSSGD